MARTTVTKSAGLDLLDRLYRNQIVVHLFSEDDQRTLKSIAQSVRAALTDAGLDGLRLERTIHLTLSLLEIRVADDFEDLAGDELRKGLEDQVTKGTLMKVSAYLRDVMSGMVLAIAGAPDADQTLVIDLANTLVEECRGAPATVRHRLAERAFAVEFPNAPVEVFAWLAHMQLLQPAKHRSSNTLGQTFGPVSIRAASLWELDTVRMGVASAASSDSANPALWMEKLAKLDVSSVGAMRRLVDAIQALKPPSSSKVTMCRVLSERWGEKDYVASLFTLLHDAAPWLRTELKPATALSDIAGAMIAGRHRAHPERALYAEAGTTNTIAHDIANELQKRGFEMNPKTLYLHYRGTHSEHADNLRGYLNMLREIDVALPAEYPDIYHLYQVALTT